jgi:putative ABC transport system permease protein
VLGGTAHHHGRELDLTFRLVDLEGGQWRPTVTDGRMPRVTGRDEPPEILLSEAGAQELGVQPGDLIRVRAAYLNGGELEDRDIDVRVAGLQPIPLRFSAFMDYEEAYRFGMRGLANEFSATPASGETVETVQQELFDTPDVAVVEPVATTSRIFRHLVDQYLSLLVIVQVTALALALLIAFNTAQIALDERSREHATMFAFGTRLRTVLSMSVVESALIGAAGTVMGIIGGRIVVEFIVRAVLVDVVPDVGFVVWISLATLVTAAALGIATVALAPLIGTRRLMNTNVPDALRVVE